MIQLLPCTKIYVYCPAGIVSGGPELLHQLVDIINSNNRQAFIVYYGDKEHKVPTEYSSYNIKLASKIEDSKENIVVIPEGLCNLLREGEYIQKLLWWLSVDHFFMLCRGILNPLDLIRWDFRMGIKTIAGRLFRLLQGKNYLKNNLSLRKMRSMQITHAYQSEYAQSFLLKNGFDNLCPLKDYINTELCNYIESDCRENIILYNPKKGLEFTKRLIGLTSGIQWIPVQNMTRAELVSLMQKSKLYIDFGYHPGKDRLPREAAMNGCCIITGEDGSAGYFEDVPIGRSYKFNQKKISKNDIAKSINYVINNYDSCIKDFDYYRKSILVERDEFIRQVKFLFNL